MCVVSYPVQLQRRLTAAKEELTNAKSLEWDLRLVNDCEFVAWEKLRDAVGRWFGLPFKSET